MSKSLERITALQEICALPQDFHEAGVMSDAVLNAIFRYASAMQIENSVETGCGKSTLLLSWLSRNHTVFTLERYGDLPCLSYERVRHSELLNPEVVSFVPGASQLTLPNHRFDAPVQLALIDGPHGFPFPFIEYYYLYPQLAEDALLIVDDIHIPTIRWLHDFLVEDDMFEFLEIVGNTSFVRRTAHPALNPTGDDWWLQRYNTNRVRKEKAVDSIPSGSFRRLGNGLLRQLRRFLER